MTYLSKAIEQIKKAWVLWVVVGAIVLSTAILAASIAFIHTKEQMFVEESAWDNIPPLASANQQGQSASKQEDSYIVPTYLLAFDETNELPAAKDIGVEQAAEIAAKFASQVLGANLDGEICQAVFNSAHVSMDNRGSWTMQFGSNTPGDLRYIVSMDSVSGEISYATKYYYAKMEEAEASKIASEMEDVVLPNEYVAFREAMIKDAQRLAKEYLLDGRKILSVRANKQEDAFSNEASWGDTQLGFPPHISVYILLEDHSEIQLIYALKEGFLKEVYVNKQSYLTPDTAAQAATVQPNEPIEEIEFNYEAHWDSTEEQAVAG